MILKIEGLERRFGGNRAVNDASFDVERGSITALIGPNGAGKTTCFNCIAGALKPDRGIVKFEGKKITGMPPYKVFRRGLHRTFQTPQPFEKMTVIENMLVPPSRQIGERMLGPLLFPGKVKREEEKLLNEALFWLENVEMNKMHMERADSLSGGQRKLLEMARAMMDKPKMLLLDEPTAGVNPVLAEKIGGFIQKVRDSTDITFLMVSHDMTSVQRVCDKVIVMANGSVLTEGTPFEVMSNSQVREAYLGGR